MTYTVRVTEEICIAHQLHLDYESKCNSLHGHNEHIAVEIVSEKLNASGMVVDFSHVKEIIRKYDHTFLGVPPANVTTTAHRDVEPSTAENFARVLMQQLREAVRKSNIHAQVSSVSVWETPNNCVRVEGAE